MFVPAAALPRCVVDGTPQPDLRWQTGNLSIGDASIEFRGRSPDAFALPLASVVRVTGLSFRTTPPPVEFGECILLHHLDAKGVQVATAIAYPRHSVGNVPLQLAGALTGTIPVLAIDTSEAAGGPPRMQEARFSMDGAGFVVERGGTSLRIRLEDVAGVETRAVRLADGRDGLEWVIHHVDGPARVAQVSLLAADRLHFLAPLLQAVQGLRQNASRERGVDAASFSAIAQQVAVMLYVGDADAAALQTMLKLTPDEIERIYEDLLARGLADVVRVRKEIRLNAAGAKLVDDIMRQQTQLAGG
jgi:hypothetical protein